MVELTIILSFWVTPAWALEALDPYVVCVEHFDSSECGCEALRWPWESSARVCEGDGEEWECNCEED